MFDKLKQLFKKSAPAPSVPQPASAAPAAAPVAPAKPAAPSAPSAPPKPATSAAAAPAGATAATPVAAPATRTPTGDELAIPLQAIVEKLPASLARKVASPNETLLIPKKLVTQQLPSGSVKLAFGDLRRLAPAGALLEAGEDDQKLVEIPLSEILPRLSPSDFGRRTDQRVIEIPEDVAGLFGPKGEPVTPPKTTVIGVAPVETPTQKPSPAPAPQPKPAAPPPAPKPTAAPVPAPAAAKAPEPPVAPPPPPAPKPAEPKPAEPAVPLKVSSDLLQQMAAATSAAAAKPAASPPPPAPVAPAPAPAAAPAAPPGMVAVPVGAVSASWPEEIKAEIQQFKLADGNFLVPVDDMSKALKTGKVAFAWSQLLAWTNPALKSKSGNVTVELALKVVAPLFLAVSKLPAPKKKVEVDPNIPDMFVGKGAPEAAPASSAPAAAPAPAPTPAPVPAPAPAPSSAAVPAPKPSSAPAPAPPKPTIAVRTPAEAVQAVIKLPGIAGAVVASEDGLSVAAQVLPPLAGDKVAAFAPQLFQRTAQYSRDLGAGNLEELSFTCNGATWRVRRCGKVYLAVVSQPQRSLPLAELAQLERELSKM